MNSAPEVVPLFPTPLVIFDIPDAAALNADLRRVIEQRVQSHPSTHKSNMGGWQSSWDMDRWGGVPAIKLLAHARNLANRMTTDQQGVTGKGPYPDHFAVTSSTRTPAPTGRASIMSMTPASPPIRPWAASSSSWTHAGRCR
jgi:hypothetical protein